MIQYPVYPNAPIVESVLDIQVEPSEGVTLENIDTFHDHVKDRFPKKEKRARGMAQIRISEQGPSFDSPSVNLVSFLYSSIIEKKIVQAGLNGFSFNKLKPYESWEIFSSEAHQLWDLYIKIAQPIKIKRMALRYINRIEIPLPISDFKEYILTIPEIAPNLPQGLASFLMMLVIPNPEIGATAIINEVMETTTVQQTLPIIFDIDVFKDVNYNINYDELWKEFDQLRIFKNDIFFNSMTDKAKELFK